MWRNVKKQRVVYLNTLCQLSREKTSCNKTMFYKTLYDETSRALRFLYTFFVENEKAKFGLKNVTQVIKFKVNFCRENHSKSTPYLMQNKATLRALDVSQVCKYPILRL